MQIPLSLNGGLNSWQLEIRFSLQSPYHEIPQYSKSLFQSLSPVRDYPQPQPESVDPRPKRLNPQILLDQCAVPNPQPLSGGGLHGEACRFARELLLQLAPAFEEHIARTSWAFMGF